MQCVLLVRDSPRALALQPSHNYNSNSDVSNSALVFENTHKTYDRQRPQCNVTLVKDTEFNKSEYRQLSPRPVYGCLGLLQVEKDMFMAVVTDCQHIGEIRPGESVHRISDVEFYSLTNSSYDSVSNSYASYSSTRIYDEDGILSPQSEQPVQNYINLCAPLKKLLSNGHFYFSSDFDLTRTLAARITMTAADKYSFDDNFLWNKYMIKELLNFRSKLSKSNQADMDRCGFLVLAIQGYIGRQETIMGSMPVSLSVISKLSCKRAGTRYNTRGIDDDGKVANFVETETILQMPTTCFSYVQIRGSVPVFWEQQGLQVMSHKIQISRGPAATQPAVERHFNELQSRYGDVDVINLLGIKEGESVLSKEYKERIDSLNGNGIENRVRMTNFDFHTVCKNGSYDNVSLLLSQIRERLEFFNFFVLDKETNSPIFYQKGVFRTNCVDCLDRTNVVQTIISKTILDLYLRQILSFTRYDTDGLFSRHSYLWAENGDSLSKIYAGTGALKSEFTRSGKLTWSGVLGDATKSVNRFYINNFQDKSKQEVIDLLLGKLMYQKVIEIHDPVHELVLEDMQKRTNDFSTKSSINVFVGSYNLNGRLPHGESLSSWLFAFDYHDPEPELYVIGFQEIVELMPQQVFILRRIWEKEISETLERRPNKRSDYVILRSGQLVGTALVIYARSDIVSNIRNVEYLMKKTGLGGMAGNKGAVAIRLDYHDTSMCFVTAHLASGHSNWEERNRDYKTIHDGLLFRNGRRLEHHEIIIWLGDFNYRISLGNEEVRNLIADNNFNKLLKADQLTKQIEWGQSFTEYIEGPITFYPTYKFDNGTDNYDTSEKARVPAWTDRILYSGNKIQQIGYSRAEIRLSDHRPVMSSFDIEVIKYDEAAKEKIQRDLYFEKLKLVSQANPNTSSNDEGSWNKVAKNVRKVNNPLLGDKFGNGIIKKKLAENKVEPVVGVLIDLDGKNNRKEENLPPPSSETHQWWINDSGPNKMHLLSKSSPKINVEPGKIKSDKTKGLRMINKMSKFKVSNKECFKVNGMKILKTAAEITKIVPYLDSIISLSDEIMKIHENATYNEKTCRLMADRVDLAMTSIKLLKRHVNDDNNKSRRQMSYQNALVYFIEVLKHIKTFVANISGTKGFKKYFIANAVTNQFNEIRDEFDNAYKALHLAISIDHIISREKEDIEYKLELEEYKKHYETINNMGGNISLLTKLVERIDKNTSKDDKLLDDLRPPEIHPNDISLPENSEFHEDIELRKYKNLDVACKKIESIQDDTPVSKKIHCLILEWAELNNLKYVYEHHKLSWDIKLNIARDVFQGLGFLHAIGILHHDVRAENMLVTSGYKCKISNFNLSRELNTESREISDLLQIVRWMAPEKLKKLNTKNPYNYACEMYSFGMFLWELSFNRIPYENLDPEGIEEHVLKGNRETLEFEKGPSDIIEGFTKIITLAWQEDHRIRPKDPAVTRILESLVKSRSNKGISPMVPYEQNKTVTVTSLEISRNISDTEYDIEYDENLDNRRLNLIPFWERRAVKS
ncbi:8673_t:CDS:10 [Funneliformis mosseae]|uniref:phosphoinositide 5-phosphatase n=1 Tax=Funneliformis mosseae TaxID=27381 RepID=A0A9N8YNJ3_FUNMO|nr:8673_t:CDS:10 [Funneliformis mosseae]